MLNENTLFEASTKYTKMINTTAYKRPYPDTSTVPSELSFEGVWDGEAISKLIREKSEGGETPAFLFLGRREAVLLKEYLAEVFGEDSVANLNGTYYLGLDVVTVNCETFLSTGGRKSNNSFQDLNVRRATWQSLDVEGHFKFRA
jgi:hypothetical protein